MRRIIALLAVLAAGFGGFSAAPAQAAPKFHNALGIAAPAVSKPQPAKFPPGGKGLYKPGPVAQIACGTCYYYAGGSGQTATTTGAQVQWDPYNVSLAAADHHSLVELEVASAASGSNQVVEVGWNVDNALYGNTSPHLFVSSWKNGVWQGYNGGTYSNAAGCAPCAGGLLTGGTYLGVLLNSVIQHLTTAQCGCATAGWWIAYNGVWQGVYPDTTWTSPTFTSAGFQNAYGEVSVSDTQPCTDMGNGTLATLTPSAAGARIGNFGLLGNAAAGNISPLNISNSAKWNAIFSPVGSVKSMRVGGPGWC